MKPLTTHHFCLNSPKKSVPFKIFLLIGIIALVGGCTNIDGDVLKIPAFPADVAAQPETQAAASQSAETQSAETQSAPAAATQPATAAQSATVSSTTASQPAATPQPAAGQQSSQAQVTSRAQIITDVSGYAIPAIAPTVQSYSIARIATGGARANIRSGPSSEYDIIGKGLLDSRYTVVSSSSDQQWWQICCIEGPNDTSGSPATYGWVADSVVAVENSLDVTDREMLLQPSTQSQWDVQWACQSERCEIRDCTATIDGIGRTMLDQQWLEVNHRVTWSNTCFSTDDWNYEVNLYTGQERGEGSPDNFLYRYWSGQQGNRINSVVKLPDGRAVAAWCSGGERVEVPEAEGWKTVYIGSTCHDVRTGMLLTLSYRKQWLFTGQFAGNSYVDAFFGDYEVLEQSLAYTNAQLLFISER